VTKHSVFLERGFSQYQRELRQLPLRTRNRVRTILTLEAKDAVQRLNELRNFRSAGELARIDRVLRSASTPEPLLPPLFPSEPQTGEEFQRLACLSAETQLRLLDALCEDHFERLKELIHANAHVGELILKRDWAAAETSFESVYRHFGYSHCLLRKAVLARARNKGTSLPVFEQFLTDAGLSRSNVLVTSLVHCYQEEQDFLSIKRSVMNLQDQGKINRFTRDICRIPFQPLAADQDDLAELLQSASQASLIDAVVLAKANRRFVRGIAPAPFLEKLFDELETSSPTLDRIASQYLEGNDNECEHLFYKHSSAWLEVDSIVKYRTLQDHFYDYPETAYLRLRSDDLNEISTWVRDISLDELASTPLLTCHDCKDLEQLEREGQVTRSSIFNYLIFKSQGFTTIQEANLVAAMGRTRDLSKTIHQEYATNLAQASSSSFSKLILYLLIAKKSRNERDDHLLRRVFQELVSQRFNGDVVALFDFLGEQSSAIARYAYEICTEDFIAKLFYIIRTSSEITETRANLHQWMGRYSGDKAYLDRARTLLIDHQITKVRNEIDDNRIYVDAARFQEWLNDEVLSEFSALLSGIEHTADAKISGDALLFVLLERCYLTFCSNKVFGIASYLGRRIRHGTFKGHLYSSVMNIEREERYGELFADIHFRHAWQSWKSTYESAVDEIIRERLHIASNTKKEGLLRPSSIAPTKQEVLAAAANSIAREYFEIKSTISVSQLITEYCWRLAEVDLKAFNSHLKNKRRELLTPEHLMHLKASVYPDALSLCSEFCRDLSRTLDDKFRTMYTWFKRPVNVSPKASLALLFRAVVEEVREIFPNISGPLESDADSDIELFGGAYHVLYDAFYVVVYNAAKHGREGGAVAPKFSILIDPATKRPIARISIYSDIRNGQSAEDVSERLRIRSDDDVENAQLYERRSGIPKLYQLEIADPHFSVHSIQCIERKVVVTIEYALEY
jgi:hypothetical protein